MPRPTSALTAGVDWEDAFSRVEAPAFRYSGSHVRITGNTVVVSGQGFEDTYTLDGPPVVENPDVYVKGSGAVIGHIDGVPVVIIRDTGCKCHGSRKVPK